MFSNSNANGIFVLVLGEKSPALQRSLSCDSISPTVSHPSLTHQPSSLSLNDADDVNEKPEVACRRVSSNPELDVTPPDEPEAVIVEVVDDVGEFTSPLDSKSLSDQDSFIR